MMNGTKFSSDYLDLYGITITITNRYTGAVTFKVDGSSGQVTINGKVTMGAGSSIDWSTVTEQNVQWSEAYSLAHFANTNANQAWSDAAYAYDEASVAWPRANQAYYDRCTDGDIAAYNLCGVNDSQNAAQRGRQDLTKCNTTVK